MSWKSPIKQHCWRRQCDLPGEESAVDVSEVVIDGPASAVPPCQVDGRLPEEGNVGLGPGVLVTTDHNAGIVTPQEKQVLQKY